MDDFGPPHMPGRRSPLNQRRQRTFQFYAPLAGAVALLLVAACFFARHSEQLLRWAVRTGYLHLDLGYTVRIVVPNGFRGVVTITEDTEDGQAPVRIGNTFEYHIPHSGLLRTNDAIPFMTWHRPEARYTDGSPLRTEGRDVGGEDEIMLRGLGSGSVDDGSLDWYYVVGTRDDVDDWFSQFGRVH